MTPAGARLDGFLARTIVELKGGTMPELGGKRLAGELVSGIRASVGKAMDESKLQIAGAVTELVIEIRDGTKQVVKAVQAEAMAVRGEFSDIIGNAQAAADDAVEQAKKAAAQAEPEIK